MFNSVEKLLGDAALAGTSHDIKALVNGVTCMSQLLEGTPLSIEQAEIVLLLKKSAEELTAMMTQVLEQSKPEAKPTTPRIENFNVNDTIETIFNTFRLTLQDRPIETKLVIEGKVPATVKGNRSALHRILSNLLQNSGKFTQLGSIELHVNTNKNTANQTTLTFQVIDTGCGIAPENLARIFNRFEKFNSEGYGIGLATVKELVTQQGGNISVQSHLEAGTRFTFSLPFEIAKFSENSKTIPLSIRALKDVKILVADDDIVYSKYLKTILTEANAQITMVKNGEEALEYCHSQRFDLILLDLQLPEIDGYETAFQIRNTLNLNRHAAIVGMSAGEADKAKIIVAGMDDLLPKPLNTEGLLSRLQRVLNVDKSDFDVLKIEKKDCLDFNEKLNVAYLQAFYGNDVEHAAMMFETFLEETLPVFYELKSSLQKNNLTEIKEKLHRLKPAFLMVGLTEAEQKLAYLELHIPKLSKQQIGFILHEIETIVTNFKPILEQELNRLNYVFKVIAA